MERPLSDFFELDFLAVEAAKSGDAIAMRYSVGGVERVHVVDGGYRDTGHSVVEHVRTYFRQNQYVDAVVATHPDGDHCAGLAQVLEDCSVGELWMLRPWNYATELLPRFSRFTTVAGLIARLRECYPFVAELEAIAMRKRIPIYEPFQSAQIGAFTVLAPSRSRYLQCVLDSEKTPDARSESLLLQELLKKIRGFSSALWGAETFPTDETSAENEMSVVQFARIADQSIVLTADSGRAGLQEAADFAPRVGLLLPGVSRFQVPHHGSRRNVSTELLDRWLGARLPAPPQHGSERFTAIISSAKEDKDHPRKAVVRAMIHRGAKVLATEGRTISTYAGTGGKAGWVPAVPQTYPNEQEE